MKNPNSSNTTMMSMISGLPLRMIPRSLRKKGIHLLICYILWTLHFNSRSSKVPLNKKKSMSGGTVDDDHITYEEDAFVTRYIYLICLLQLISSPFLCTAGPF